MEIAENIRRRIVANIKSAVVKLYRYTIWRHIIYKPIEKARWRIPKGMTTLEEFLNWHREMGIEEKRNDHPLALEVYVSFTTDHELTKREIDKVSELLGNNLYDEMFAEELLEMMETGYDVEKVTEYEEPEGGWRVSRNGERFTEKDLFEKRWFRDMWGGLGL